MKQNLRIWVVEKGVSPDTDVTAAVQALYDLAVNSMDYGSGFWSAEDAEPVALLAKLCGFDGRKEIEKYIESQRFMAERGAYFRDTYWGVPGDPHDHRYAVVNGQCLWPGCKAKREAGE